MSRRIRPEELTEQELRRLLLEKRRVSRKSRLDRFRQTGRALNLTPDLPDIAQHDWQSQAGTIPAEQTNSAPILLSRRRRWLDRILFVVEILAILGLAGVLLNGMGMLRTLNEEVVAAWQQNTPEPTPLITAVVLPSGHVSPQESDVSQQNWGEVPAHLQDIARSFENLPIPTTGPEAAISIQIPAIKVDSRIFPGDNWEQLRKGVGQHLGTPDPGETGNLVLAGHNDIYGEVFKDLDRLKPGDTIHIFTITHQYVYVVTGTQIVEPTQVEVMAPTSNSIVTLISCYPYLVDNKRIVVKATLQNP
ncbi:MAG: sortase [Chloroflexota bacterium]